MFSFLKGPMDSTKGNIDDQGAEQLSRFAPKTQDDGSPLEQLGKLTRFEARKEFRSNDERPVKHVVPKRPARLAPRIDAEMSEKAPPLTQAVDETAHLHEDSNIPLWVIRKALPERFAQPLAEDDDLAFQ